MPTQFIIVAPVGRASNWPVVDDTPRPLELALAYRDAHREGNVPDAMLQVHIEPERTEEAQPFVIYASKLNLDIMVGDMTRTHSEIVARYWHRLCPWMGAVAFPLTN